jgi:hypothetical protein
MTSTLVVIFITAGVSVAFFLIVALPLVLTLRARDRRRRSKEEVAGQFSSGQGVRLSVGSNNYSHVPEPRTSLRRSTHLPRGVVSEGWVSVPSQDNLPPRQVPSDSDLFGATGTLNHHKRRRSLRASFSAHAFSLPKTRRQKKIEKAIPLCGLPRSPLSAITEQSGTNTSEASPLVGIAELPTEITPKNTPDKDEDAASIQRPASPQWPLTSRTTSKRASLGRTPTVLPVPTSPKSTLMRTDSTGQDMPLIPPSSVKRSISVASTLSLAPGDPLPPLPSITPSQWAPARKSGLRLSATSFDTIGSSVLEGGRTTPSQTDTDLMSAGLGTPPIDLYPTAFHGHDRPSQKWEPAKIVTTGSPEARHSIGYRSGKDRYGFSRASISNTSSLQNIKSEQVAHASDRSSLIPRPCGSALTVLDASKSRSGVLSRANAAKPSISPLIPTATAQTGPRCKKGTAAARHSMYEQDVKMNRLNADSAVLRDVPGNQTSSILHLVSSRPASVASENPFHWDRNGLQTGLSPVLKASPESQHKGHKRQNCVRISNLPAVDPRRKAGRLPQMTEEEEDTTETPTRKTTKIPRLSLLGQERQDNEDAAYGEQEVNTSPFLTRPIWETTLWKRLKSPQAMSSEIMVHGERDSDVFSNSRYDPSAPNIFTANSTPQRQWPLSSAPKCRARPRATSPSLSAVQEPCNPDSPTLPTPVLSSATLFTRPRTPGSRKSAVRGPRNLHTSSLRPRTAAPVPAATFAAEREDLRRSAIALSKVNSEANDKTRMSRGHRSIRGKSKNSLLDASKSRKQDPAPQASAAAENFSTGIKSPNTSRTNVEIPRIAQPLVPPSPFTESAVSSGRLRFNKSRGKIAPSLSIISAGAASIWEDASVRGDSPEPELPTASKTSSPYIVDVEAYENFIGQDEDVKRNKPWGNRLTSPERTGLGLTGVQMHGKPWGTPGSLYDGDGFLKD